MLRSDQAEAFLLWYQWGGKSYVGTPEDFTWRFYHRGGKTAAAALAMALATTASTSSGSTFVTRWERGDTWFRSVGWRIDGDLITYFGRHRGALLEVARLALAFVRKIADDGHGGYSIMPGMRFKIMRDDELAITNDLFLHANGWLQ